MNERTAAFIEQFKLALAIYDHRLLSQVDKSRHLHAVEVATEHLGRYALPSDTLARALEAYQRSREDEQKTLIEALIQDFERAAGI